MYRNLAILLLKVGKDQKLSSLSTEFRWRPPDFFLETLSFFDWRPQIFFEDSQNFMRDPQNFIGELQDIHWRPLIFRFIKILGFPIKSGGLQWNSWGLQQKSKVSNEKIGVSNKSLRSPIKKFGVSYMVGHCIRTQNIRRGGGGIIWPPSFSIRGFK